ncbi:argininosuccinate synthase domain-containing protein [Burkholderia perseverans]|uniref:argininosuccinate synthase domain-containing protein n=1 Tax=Burkholderia perseverans TaxID=2615214 RepID=UPI001FEF4BC0|nr:argininosuccinate synthase domain-containing protein [Burkholderia perseverans]
MTTIVLAGGGLSSWYVTGRLIELDQPVEVWFADVDQCDEALAEPFVRYLEQNRIPFARQDIRAELADLGLEAARAQARHRTGYWNTTGLLRAGLISGCSRWLAGERPDATAVAHGCVAFGNDQRRFQNLFAELHPAVSVQASLAQWNGGQEAPTRRFMVDAIARWTGERPAALEDKVAWSSDGSLLGISHEGTEIERHDSDWTTAPFAMTRAPFDDAQAEDLTLHFEHGHLVQVGETRGDALALLAQANARAGAHGLGRIGVMETRLKGTKCRGVYEAPGLTLVGLAWAALQELALTNAELERIDALSRQLCADAYAGLWYGAPAVARRAEFGQVCGALSGAVTVALRGGFGFVRRIDAGTTHTGIERRFAGGGTQWSE